jgi:hypothetical protein
VTPRPAGPIAAYKTADGYDSEPFWKDVRNLFPDSASADAPLYPSSTKEGSQIVNAARGVAAKKFERLEKEAAPKDGNEGFDL